VYAILSVRRKCILALSISKLKVIAGAILSLCLLIFLVGTLHWPMISDATFVHYALFLMHQGMAPYRDIIDINMPGTYLAEDIVTHIFGNGALGWRLFDFTLLAISTFAMAVILKPYGRFEGFFAGAIFALMHGADGPAQSGQRDLVIAVLLLAGCASLFEGLRKSAWIGVAFFGFCLGSAATIKLQAAFFGIAMLLAVAYACYKRNLPNGLYLSSGIAGFLVSPIASLVFLIHQNALHVFTSITQELVLYHASMGRHSMAFLVSHAIPALFLPLVLIALWMAARDRFWLTFEGFSVLLGACFGFISFCLQGKAYPYHRYPLLVFLWVLIASQFSISLKSTEGKRILAVVGIAYAVLWLAPAAMMKSLRYNVDDERSLVQLRSDILDAGEPELAGKIQCLDTTAGCLTVLDQLQLTEATGAIYDCYLFAPTDNPVRLQVREQFWRELTKERPKIFIVTNQWCFDLPSGYKKLDQWPQFQDFLGTHYNLTVQREWKTGHNKYLAMPPFGYRIYSAKGS
jgi:Dolichyl-phosphate-mannose-protein mannosyltransferase